MPFRCIFSRASSAHEHLLFNNTPTPLHHRCRHTRLNTQLATSNVSARITTTPQSLPLPPLPPPPYIR